MRLCSTSPTVYATSEVRDWKYSSRFYRCQYNVASALHDGDLGETKTIIQVLSSSIEQLIVSKDVFVANAANVSLLPCVKEPWTKSVQPRPMGVRKHQKLEMIHRRNLCSQNKVKRTSFTKDITRWSSGKSDAHSTSSHRPWCEVTGPLETHSEYRRSQLQSGAMPWVRNGRILSESLRIHSSHQWDPRCCLLPLIQQTHSIRGGSVSSNFRRGHWEAK